MSELGELLRELRGRKSLREASKITGLSYSYISSLEKGMHPKTKAPIQASPESLKAFSKAYNYPYEDLMRKAGYLEEDINKEDNRGEFITDEYSKEVLELFSKLPEDEKISILQFLKIRANKK